MSDSKQESSPILEQDPVAKKTKKKKKSKSSKKPSSSSSSAVHFYSDVEGGVDYLWNNQFDEAEEFFGKRQEIHPRHALHYAEVSSNFNFLIPTLLIISFRIGWTIRNIVFSINHKQGVYMCTANRNHESIEYFFVLFPHSTNIFIEWFLYPS